MSNKNDDLYCKLCGYKGEFSLPYNGASLRESLCGNCKASRRTRDLVSVLLELAHVKESPLINSLKSFEDWHILEFQAQGPLHDILKKLPHYQCAEYFDDIPLGKVHKSGILNQNLQCLTLASATTDTGFDIVITQDVFEYLENPWAAFSEIERILKPSGKHLFTVPVHNGRKTITRTQKLPNNILNYILPPIYYTDTACDSASLVFTDFGDDLVDSLEKRNMSAYKALHTSFYTPEQIPSFITEKDEQRYNFFASRKQSLKFFLYDSIVYVALGKQNPQVPPVPFCLRFQDETNMFQISSNAHLFESSTTAINIPSIRGETVFFNAKTVLMLDITLDLENGQNTSIVMVEACVGAFTSFTFPSIFSESTELFSFVQQKLYPFIEKIKNKGERFFIDHNGNDIVDSSTSEKMKPGQVSYHTVLPYLRRFDFVLSRCKTDECAHILSIGSGQGYGIAMLTSHTATSGIGLEAFGLETSGLVPNLANEISPKKNQTHITWLHESVEQAIKNKSLPAQHFNLITCFENIDHLESPHSCFDLAIHALAPQGEFYLSIPNPHFPEKNKTHYYKQNYSFSQVKILAETHFASVGYFFQDDVIGDLTQRFLITDKENLDAKFWIICCKDPLPQKNDVRAVSLIMPLYNNFEYTEKSIASIYENTPTSLNWELILIDNGSTDATTKYQARDERTIIFRNTHNVGFAKASNQGALIAKGSILVFLNSAIEVSKGWLETLVEELTKNPTTGLASARLIHPNHTILHAGFVIGRDLLPYAIHQGIDANAPCVMERRAFPALTEACLAARKDEFMDIGMFDEFFVNDHESIDLCIRYRERNFQCIYCPECLIVQHENLSKERTAFRALDIARTLSKSRKWLIQDDFIYDALEKKENLRICQHPLRFAIKIEIADRTEKDWEGISLAEYLAKELIQAGHTCVIHYMSEWGKEDKDIDVVIHSNGLFKYHPKPWNTNLMLVLSHPELRAKKEMELYDAICVNSDHHTEFSLRQVSIPVFKLIQAINLEHSKPLDTINSEQSTHDNTPYNRVEKLEKILHSIQTPDLLSRIEQHKKYFDSSFRTNGPLVSIIMCTYNRRAYLPAAIESILSQTYTNWELCLVCDGGTAVDDLVEKFQDSRIKLTTLDKNMGKSHASNQAFQVSKGEYIAYLDDDDIWYPDHLERLMFAVRAIPGFEMVYSNAEACTLDMTNPLYTKEVSRKLLYSRQVALASLLEYNSITGISVLHTRRILVAAGEFDAKLKVLIDFDMWRRLACFSYPYHVSYLTAEYYTRKNIKSDNISNISTRDPIAYAKYYLRIIAKQLPFSKEEDYSQELAFLLEKMLFEYFRLRCEHALENNNPVKCAKLIPILNKYYRESRDGMRYAAFLMNRGNCKDALGIIKKNLPLHDADTFSLLMAFICAVEVKDSFALKIHEVLTKNLSKMTEDEIELYANCSVKMKKYSDI